MNNEIKNSSKSNKKNGGIRSSQSENNRYVKMKSNTIFNDNKTKRYRGDVVDALLSYEVLERLNDINEIDICSVCSGHQKGVSSMKRGGGHYPGINFRIYPYFNSYYVGVYDDIKESVLLPNTKVTVEFEENFPSPSYEQCSLIIQIESTIPMCKKNLGKISRWWNILVKRMENVEWNIYLNKKNSQRRA